MALKKAGLSRFRIDKEEMWLDELPAERAAILDGELRAMGLSLDDVQPWFWSGTISAVRREWGTAPEGWLVSSVHRTAGAALAVLAGGQPQA